MNESMTRGGLKQRPGRGGARAPPSRLPPAASPRVQVPTQRPASMLAPPRPAPAMGNKPISRLPMAKAEDKRGEVISRYKVVEKKLDSLSGGSVGEKLMEMRDQVDEGDKVLITKLTELTARKKSAQSEVKQAQLKASG